MSNYNKKELQTYLNKIDRVFKIDKLLSTKVDEDLTVKYYRANGKYYRWLHSKQGAMHFPLYFKTGREGRSHAEGLLQQPLHIQKKVRETNAMRILELGSGQGFNSIFLAEQNPHAEVIGVDLTPSNIAQSKRQAKYKEVENVRFKECNFEQLHFADNSFDLVFAIESLSHSQHIEHALSEAQRVLKPGGQLIVFDGFLQQPIEVITDENLKKAAQLFTIGFAMHDFRPIKSWLEVAEKAGFQLLHQEDLSVETLPNLINFQKGSKKIFDYPRLSKIILGLRLLPIPLLKHAISGVLGPYIMQSKTVGYYCLELRT